MVLKPKTAATPLTQAWIAAPLSTDAIRVHPAVLLYFCVSWIILFATASFSDRLLASN